MSYIDDASRMHIGRKGGSAGDVSPPEPAGPIGYGNGAKNEKPKKIEKPTETEAPIVTTSPETTTETNDGALVAAITAAISVVLASEQGETSASGFRVVSFKRVGGKSAWNVK